jgi:hypothetical protein
MAIKLLRDLEWVTVACSRDEARPVMTGILVEEKRIIATDGRRLHIAARPAGMMKGLWHHARPVQIEGKYPDFDKVIPTSSATHSISAFGLGAAIADLLRLNRANQGSHYDYTAGFEKCAFNPKLLAELLQGFIPHDPRNPVVPIEMCLTSPMAPLRVSAGARIGVIMPVRVPTVGRESLRVIPFGDILPISPITKQGKV